MDETERMGRYGGGISGGQQAQEDIVQCGRGGIDNLGHGILRVVEAAVVAATVRANLALEVRAAEGAADILLCLFGE